MWPLALIVFVASILVPLLKLITLCCLLVSVQRRFEASPKRRTRLYRVTEGTGGNSFVWILPLIAALLAAPGEALGCLGTEIADRIRRKQRNV